MNRWYCVSYESYVVDHGLTWLLSSRIKSTKLPRRNSTPLTGRAPFRARSGLTQLHSLAAVTEILQKRTRSLALRACNPAVSSGNGTCCFCFSRTYSAGTRRTAPYPLLCLSPVHLYNRDTSQWCLVVDGPCCSYSSV